MLLLKSPIMFKVEFFFYLKTLHKPSVMFKVEFFFYPKTLLTVKPSVMFRILILMARPSVIFRIIFGPVILMVQEYF